MSFFGDLLHRFKDDSEAAAEPSIAEKVSEGIRSRIGKARSVSKCPKCRKPLPENMKFCSGCGYQLRLSCRKCSIDYPLGTEFCPECGNQLK